MTNQPPRLTPTSGTTAPSAFTIERPLACSMLIWASEVLEHSPVNVSRLDRNRAVRRMIGCSPVMNGDHGSGSGAPCRSDQSPHERLYKPTPRPRRAEHVPVYHWRTGRPVELEDSVYERAAHFGS